jgi:hypothetical protein
VANHVPHNGVSLIAGSRATVAVANLPRYHLIDRLVHGAKAGRLDQNIRVNFGLVGKTDSPFR